MEVVHARCAGLDVHKRTVVACVLQSGAAGAVEREERTFGTMLADLEALAGWLAAAAVSHVVLEATGVYWKPVFNVLESHGGFSVLVVNPEHVKAITGRKTDRADAARLATLLRHDLLVGSFIPDRAQREWRELTRARTGLIRERARVVQRLEKTLEGGNIKLGAVLSDLLGASGQRMLQALVAGVADPEQVVGLAHGKLAAKRAALAAALAGQLSPALRFLVQQHLEHWQELDARIAAFDAEIAETLRPFDAIIARLDAIPGVGRRTAEIILAEVGPTVARFATARHLAAWAGLSPGNRESGGKRRAARTRHGNPWLKAALTEAAWAASRCRSGYLPAQYRRLARRRGRKRAIVAVAHSLLVVIYHLLDRGTEYVDLGGSYFQQRDPTAVEHRAVADLRTLGYRVTLHRDEPSTPATEAA